MFSLYCSDQLYLFCPAFKFTNSFLYPLYFVVELIESFISFIVYFNLEISIYISLCFLFLFWGFLIFFSLIEKDFLITIELGQEFWLPIRSLQIHWGKVGHGDRGISLLLPTWPPTALRWEEFGLVTDMSQSGWLPS